MKIVKIVIRINRREKETIIDSNYTYSNKKRQSPLNNFIIRLLKKIKQVWQII